MKLIKPLSLCFIIVIILQGCQKDTEPNNLLPEAGFTYVSNKVFPVTVQFVNTSVIPAGQTATYHWDFGDGATSNIPGAVTHDYIGEGIYLVRLGQITSGGLQDTAIYAVEILNPGGSGGGTGTTPGPSFTYNVPFISTRVSFTNTSTGADSFLWTFGDGATSTTDSTLVQHTYNAAGDFNVVLRASSQNVHDTAMAIMQVQ